MEIIDKTPNFHKFQGMSYSELKKVAKKHGIKGNMKAEKIIAALSVINSDAMDSFSTPYQKEINSSKKNKEEKFNEDKMTPLATPRRGTYSIESHVSAKLDDSSASTTFDVPILDISNVTMSRGSERKLRPRKVSFMSPVRTPSTPRNSSIKHRPKTPMNSWKQDSFSSIARQGKEKMSKTISLDEPSFSSADDVNVANPFPLKVELAKSESSTPSVKQPQTDENKSNATKSLVSEEEASVKKKRAATPNFKKIHEKAFEKLESIDAYQKRKAEFSAKKIGQWQNLKPKINKSKSKLPSYTGIPFIPSKTSTTFKTLDENSKSTKVIAPAIVKQKVNDRPRKFDLKASLSRKLGYKPYTGPLKPLAESNTMNTSKAACFHKPRVPVHEVVQEKRFQTRSALKGVRNHKRLELQMRNRKLE